MLTHDALRKVGAFLTGFRRRHEKLAQRVNRGDRFFGYLSKVSRWWRCPDAIDDGLTRKYFLEIFTSTCGAPDPRWRDSFSSASLIGQNWRLVPQLRSKSSGRTSTASRVRRQP